MFWSGVCGVAVFCFLAALPQWGTAIFVAVFSVGYLSFSAYFATPYIKIGGRIYAFHIDDSEPDRAPDEPPPGAGDPDYDPYPDSYAGSVTAPKMWWLMVPGMALCSFNVATALVSAGKRSWVDVAAAAAVVVIAAGFGYMDSSWRYRIARGQTVQFVLVGVLTGGMFTLLYLTAYRIAQRWPFRPKISSEYIVHPHLRKPDTESPQAPLE